MPYLTEPDESEACLGSYNTNIDFFSDRNFNKKRTYAPFGSCEKRY